MPGAPLCFGKNRVCKLCENNFGCARSNRKKAAAPVLSGQRHNVDRQLWMQSALPVLSELRDIHGRTRRRKSSRKQPEKITDKAVELKIYGNIGVAYTYNEPLVGYEFVSDCCELAHEKGLKNVVVTNGFLNPEPFDTLLPAIDAMNIDLKGFTNDFYKLAGAGAKGLDTVKRNIASAARSCHVEVTTLIIPGENDSEEEMSSLSGFLAGIDTELPLHVTRFFPRYHMKDREATEVETVERLAETARKKLRYVYTGNC